MKKLFLLMLVACTAFIGSASFVSCQEEEVPAGTPYVDAPLRAMRNETISVAYRNIEKNVEVVVDFGDGSAPVSTKGPIAVSHTYTEPSNTQPDGAYHIKITAKGQTIEKRILVYPLRALSDLVDEITTPGYDKILVMAHRANTTNKASVRSPPSVTTFPPGIRLQAANIARQAEARINARRRLMILFAFIGSLLMVLVCYSLF